MHLQARVRRDLERLTQLERSGGPLSDLLGGETRTEVGGGLDRVEPPAAVPDLSQALVALVTEAGCVPQGNPDRLPSVRAQGWFRYELDGVETLVSGRYESVHGGFDVTLANEDPNRLVPLDTVRGLQRAGRIGRVHESLYTTTGNGTPVVVATRFGQEIAGELRVGEDQAKEGVAIWPEPIASVSALRARST